MKDEKDFFTFKDIVRFAEIISSLSQEEKERISADFYEMMRDIGRCIQCQNPNHDGLCSCTYDESSIPSSTKEYLVRDIVSYFYINQGEEYES